MQRQAAVREAEQAQRKAAERKSAESRTLMAIHDFLVCYGHEALDELVAQKKAQIPNRVDPMAEKQPT